MQLLRQFIQSIRDRRDRKATIRELRQLSSGQLRDIGIEPQQIEDVVDGILMGRRVQAGSATQGVGRLRACEQCC